MKWSPVGLAAVFNGNAERRFPRRPASSSVNRPRRPATTNALVHSNHHRAGTWRGISAWTSRQKPSANDESSSGKPHERAIEVSTTQPVTIVDPRRPVHGHSPCLRSRCGTRQTLPAAPEDPQTSFLVREPGEQPPAPDGLSQMIAPPPPHGAALKAGFLLRRPRSRRDPYPFPSIDSFTASLFI